MRPGSVRLAPQEGSSCMPSDGPREPIIETPTHEPGREEPGDRALRLRLRQQEILAELGVTALKGTPFDDLLRKRWSSPLRGWKLNSARRWSTYPRKTGS